MIIQFFDFDSDQHGQMRPFFYLVYYIRRSK